VSLMDEKPCTTCKNYYDLEVNEWHTYCQESHCVLCVQVFGISCDNYEKGEVPEGKVRGELF